VGTLRRARLLIGALLLVAGAALALLQAWSFVRQDSDPSITYGVPAKLEPDYGQAVGANVDWLGLSPEEMNVQLGTMRQHGLTWARQHFPWADLEPRPGEFSWEEADAVVDAIAQAGLQLVAVLDTSPEWAVPGDQAGQRWSPPADYARFGDFAAAFARRYCDRVTHYQVWDQPNIYPFWGDRYVDPEAYAALLREAATRIRAEDESSVVLMAGLAPNVEMGPLNINEVDFLRGVLAAGAGAYFDVAAVKAYGFEEGPEDRRLEAGALNFGRAVLVRRVLLEAGYESRPVWAVEFGWNSLPEGWSGRAAPWGTGEVSVQAERSLGAVARARAEWPWMGPMLWSRLAAPAQSDDPAYGFALLESDATPTALGSLLLPRLAVAEEPPLGRQSPDSPWASYSPGWRVTGAAADPSAAGDTVTIRFQGSGLDLVVAPGPYWATWDVEIDGQASSSLPREDGRSYLVLYDPLGAEKAVTVASGLAPGVHEARLTVHGGWGQWPLRGWVSWRAAPGAASLPALSMGGLMALLGLWMLQAHRLLLAVVVWLERLGRRCPEPVWLGAAAVGGAAFWLSDGLIGSAVSGVGLALLSVVAPQWLLGLAVAALPFFLVPKSVLGFTLAMPEVLAWLLLAGSLLRAWARWRRARLRSALRTLDLGVGLLLVAALLGAAAAPNPGVAWHDLRRVLLSATVLYAAIRLNGRRSLWPAVIGAMAGAAVASGVGIWQYLQGENLITAGEVARVRAWYGSPNNLALYLGRVVPVALALAIFCRRAPARVAAAAVFAVCLVCGVLTRSRGLILLGLPASTAWLLWQTGWLRRSRGLVIGLVVALGLALLALAGGRIGQLLSGQDAAAGMRLHVWTSALNMIRQHPLLGVGPDNFLYLYRTHYILPQAWAEPNLSHPHNLVLDFWLTAGALGVAALAVLVFAGARRVRLGLRAIGAERGAYLGLGAALLAALAQGLVDNSFFLVDLSHITLAYLALLANAPGEAPRGGPTRANLSLEQIP